MNFYDQLAKAGLRALYPWDEAFHNDTCGCSMCYGLNGPVGDSSARYRNAIIQEAKTRNCSRKSCKRHGCDC